jgi:hypothetical protein
MLYLINNEKRCHRLFFFSPLIGRMGKKKT